MSKPLTWRQLAEMIEKMPEMDKNSPVAACHGDSVEYMGDGSDPIKDIDYYMSPEEDALDFCSFSPIPHLDGENYTWILHNSF